MYITELKRLGSLLGKLHDLHLLTEIIDQKQLFTGDEIQLNKLINVIEKRQLEIIQKAKTISERLFYEDSDSFAARIHALWLNTIE